MSRTPSSKIVDYVTYLRFKTVQIRVYYDCTYTVFDNKCRLVLARDLQPTTGIEMNNGNQDQNI